MNIQLKLATKTFNLKGFLAYEYNPFRNYRLDKNVIFYDGQYLDVLDFLDEYVDGNVKYDESTGFYTETEGTRVYITNLQERLKDLTKTYIFYSKGLLVDFITDELNFDLNNPVNIIPLWSYDNSVNLIINDGKNPPRIINSRFSPTEKNLYQICDRKGNNDTNIYDLGELFDIDTSLYKKVTTIPELNFIGVTYGGNLGIGNYHFYFKYVDEDGNESDFFAESGLVSIFIGNTPDSIRSGFRNENSHKLVKFMLTNTDIAYDKILIYYTKSTSNIFENAVVSAFKINNPFKVGNKNLICINGFEDVTEVPLSDINMQYLIYGAAETLAVALNMLFLANVERPETEYKELSDCALRFLPVLETRKHNMGLLWPEYSGSIKNTYYDPSYIYNSVGYWDDEIYRFGIVFIKLDGTLTEVFNVRGIDELSSDTTLDTYTNIKFNVSGTENRNYINFDEFNYTIIDDSENISEKGKSNLENAKGVVRIKHSNSNDIIGINFKVELQVINYLKDTLKIRGFFFVRLKRIPTTLCQAYTIGIDNISHTPVLPLSDKSFVTEGFLNQKNGKIVESFESRKIKLQKYQCTNIAAICPEYDVNSPYLNSLFTASEHTCRLYKDLMSLNKISNKTYSFGVLCNNLTKEPSYTAIKVIGVEDNTKLVAIGDTMFSARAGEAEEGFRYEYAGAKKIDEKNYALLRGSYGPYLGITGLSNDYVGRLMDIKIPGYNSSNMSEYFSIRYADKTPYYAISDRIDLSKKDILNFIEEVVTIDNISLNFVKFRNPFFRGDCYVCLFTHRVNRNFQDPSAPTNDSIVDPDCWKENFEVSDGIVKKENFDKINLGDLNAVPMGMYVTLLVRSTMNLNVRALDESIVDETALTGHPRGFYPYFPLTNAGAYKTPEALCYNKGFEKSVSEKYNFEVPEVPWIKNEFSNRISYSNIQVQDAFQNGWRTFMGLNYRDYPKTYGSITKILELGGNLLCVFEHGVALISVNERALAGEGSGGNVYINTSNVLPLNPKVISDKYGSQWRESIIKTPTAVYGVDTVAKKIWKTNGDTMEYISDFRILEFLNNNISLSERELIPIIGIRNVKTHYNEFKGDVMFTFYDNLYGFEERVWNICWNERQQKWITFYSWLPSYSENISNLYFSFDRNTSKWIAKLGISKYNSKFSSGITLENNIIDKEWKSTTLHFDKFKGYDIEYKLERDNYGNYKLFNDPKKVNDDYILSLRDNVNYSDLCSELYARVITIGDSKYIFDDLSVDEDGNGVEYAYKFDNPKEQVKIPFGLTQRSLWKSNIGKLEIYKNDKGKRVNLSTRDKDRRVNGDKIVLLLNIKATIKKDGAEIGEYLSTVALTTDYNLLFLSTDFWKHGQAGIIDIADKIYPTYWYGKQHPFEFEFVVADNPGIHKIFDNLEIISNKAMPESFHYEIVGECYDFAKDKKNMYIRLEATKELYQFNGSDIVFNPDYKDLISIHRPLTLGDSDPKYYDKSTIFPLYYRRKDAINEIEDYYHLYGYKDHYSKGDKNFSALAGAEIIRYENLDEYRIWNHAKAVDIKEHGLLRGNMYYKEDKWDVQINPINLVLKNESKNDWENTYKLNSSDANTYTQVPAELNLFKDISEIPNKRGEVGKLELPNDWTRNIVSWKDYEKINKEVKMKDKYIKIRVRYSGEDLAIISAIRTLYQISYG